LLLPFDARLAMVDIEAAEIGRLRDIDIPVHADCKQTLLALVAAARSTQWPERNRWCAAVRHAADWHRRRFHDALAHDSEPIHPYRAAHELLAGLDNPIVVTDGGEAINWAEMAARVDGHGAFMVTGYLGCLGTGLPYALGAQRAHPDRQVVCITGDGALGFNIQEFDTLARHRLPVITAVMNNSSWGMSAHGQDAMCGPGHRTISELQQTRYDLVAQAFGCHGEHVTRCADIRPAVRRARASGLPACINVVIDETVVAPFTEALLGQKKKESDILIPYYDNLEI
jgi:acetolactate synthase-1/2/3 large subunit